MKVGIFVTNQNPLGTDMVSALGDQFAMTRLARDRGWDAVGTGQHYLSEGMSQLQLIPFLSRLAAELHNLNLKVPEDLFLPSLRGDPPRVQGYAFKFSLTLPLRA